MEHTIDAKGKVVGRLASDIARILMGKDSPAYRTHTVAPVSIKVFNTDYIRMTGRKPKQKLYRRHSGYIGNLREETFEHMLKRDSRKVLQHALSGMLPKNKLRSRMMKNIMMYKKEI